MILQTNKVWRIFMRLCRSLATKVTSPNKNNVNKHLQHLNQRGSLMLFPRNLLGPRVLHPFGKELRHHCLLYGPDATSSTQRQLSPFPERLNLPFSCDETLSGYEDICLLTDQFTDCVKTDPHDTLVHHMVDVQKATADFREASEKRHSTSSQTNRFSKKKYPIVRLTLNIHGDKTHWLTKQQTHSPSIRTRDSEHWTRG